MQQQHQDTGVSDETILRRRQFLQWLFFKYPHTPQGNIGRQGAKGVQLAYEFHADHEHSGATRNRWRPTLKTLGINMPHQAHEAPDPVVLTKKALEDLDASVRADKDPLCRAVYAILRDTGCRGLTELRRIETLDVDFHVRTVHLRSRKGSSGLMKSRVVPMTTVAYTAFSWLYWHPASANTERTYVWPTDAQWRAFWERVRPSKRHTPYCLRHTFCTRMLDRGVPLPTVQRIMGHTTADMTMRYYTLRESAIEAARAALE